MFRLRSLVRLAVKRSQIRAFSSTVDTTYNEVLQPPTYDITKPQTIEDRKARLMYQSRKRGMLENDLLLSTFANKYLSEFDEEQTMQYDRLINTVSNDWDLFYWMVGKKPVPPEFDNQVMTLLKKHATNESKQILQMPPLRND